MKNKYLALLFVIILVSMSFIYFGRKMIDDGQKKIVRIEKTIKKDQEKLNSAKVLNKQLQQVSKVIRNSMTKKRSYNAEEVNEFINKLGDLADRFKIKIEGLSPRPSLKEGKIVEQSYSLQIICDYVQLGKFLAELERFDYIMSVNTLDVKTLHGKRDNAKVGPTRYKVAIELSTFKIIKEA
ncbi:MAG: type 4a pilus biogenesis protein PilO [Candidatus Cloacimonadota bacterium]|nr:type 4a pilus biogenesis protein PilO [Candidatus Cloacimonadota bacterium]